MDTRLAELKLLAQQRLPMWGGHLDRGEPISDMQMKAWVTDGIIQAVEKPRKGYIITDAGRQLIAHGKQNRWIMNMRRVIGYMVSGVSIGMAMRLVMPLDSYWGWQFFCAIAIASFGTAFGDAISR